MQISDLRAAAFIDRDGVIKRDHRGAGVSNGSFRQIPVAHNGCLTIRHADLLELHHIRFDFGFDGHGDHLLCTGPDDLFKGWVLDKLFNIFSSGFMGCSFF
jgi:hypothetical protein